jgi:hypothetical protein
MPDRQLWKNVIVRSGSLAAENRTWDRQSAPLEQAAVAAIARACAIQ